MTKLTINAAFLCRVSTNDQSNESQIETLNQIITLDKDNIIVDTKHIYEEKISGYTDTRSSLTQLKQAVKNGEVKRIYCIEFTRLSRKPRILINEYEYFVEQNIPIYFVNENCWTLDINNLTVNQDTRNKIYGAALWGEQELIKIKQRTTRGRNLKAKQGFFVGHVSYGYTVKLGDNGKDKLIVIDENEAKIIKDIFNKIAYENYTTTSITKYLNENDINSKWVNWVKKNENKRQTYNTNKGVEREKKSIKWTFATIKQLIKNRWYVGERQYKEFTLQHEAIITNELFNLANEKLKVNKKTDNAKKADRVYCLSNVFYCGKCGKSMNAHTTHTSSTYYCSSKETGLKCGDVGISKENIEMLIMKMITYLSIGLTTDKYLIDYFTLEQSGIKQIENEIKFIREKNDLIIKSNLLIKNQIVSLTVDKSLQTITAVKEGLENKINELNNEYNNNDKLTNQNVSQINLLTQQLKYNFDVSTVLSDINNKKDLNQISTIFHKIIEKVTLYNINSNIALIQVTFNSKRTINILYQRRKTQYNKQYIDLLNDNRDIVMYNAKSIEIDSINSPQHIYFCDNNIIKYNSESNTFDVVVDEIYSTFSNFIYGDDDEMRDFINVSKSKNDYYSHVTKGKIELDELFNLLFFWHSISYNLLFDKNSDEYKYRKQRYKELTEKSRNEKTIIKANKPVKREHLLS